MSPTASADGGRHAHQQQALALKSALLPPLTCVAVVARQATAENNREGPSAREEVGSLPHAVATISAFLDFGREPFWTFLRACEHNCLAMLPRLASREPDDMSIHYRAYLCRHGLTRAIQSDNLEMVQWLCCEYCPTGFVWNTTEAASACGRTAILQWLVTHFGCVQKSSVLMDFAAVSGHLETVQWIYDNLANDGEDYWPSGLMNAAITKEDMATVQWLHEHHPSQEPLLGLLRDAIQSGSVEIAHFLFTNGYNLRSYDALAIAAATGSIAMVRWVHSLPNVEITSSTMDIAASHGHFEIVKWLYATGDTNTEWSTTAMDYAAKSGSLEMLLWFHENQVGGCTANAMDWAAATGHLEIVKWLHENRKEGCTPHAMDGAASYGHLRVVEWLHANRWEGCLRSTVRNAAALGHVHVVAWLHENRFPGFTTSVMEAAAVANRLDVVKWLHENRREGCTARAMDDAAASNRLEVVQWLHENRTEGCTTMAMDSASSLEMVRWLHENRSEGCTTSAMDNAVAMGNFELVLWLHAHRKEGCTSQAVEIAIQFQHFEIFQWLCETYPDLRI